MIQKKVRNLLSVVLALLLCLGSLTPAFAAKNNVQADPDAELSVLDMANVDTLSGYLYERSQKNYDRLESDPLSVAFCSGRRPPIGRGIIKAGHCWNHQRGKGKPRPRPAEPGSHDAGFAGQAARRLFL